MRTIYKLAIVSLIAVAIWLGIRINSGLFGDTNKTDKFNHILQTAGLFIALGSGIIALSSADRKAKRIDVDIRVSIADEKPENYPGEIFPKDIKDFYGRSPSEVYTYKVFFKFKNLSGFTLAKPTLVFRLPIKNQHPYRLRVESPTQYPGLLPTYKKWFIGYYSSLFNSEVEIRMLDFEDAKMISNNNLPFWNDSDVYEIWVKMCLDKNTEMPVKVTVSVNSENAEGITREVEIPNKLIPDK